MSAIELRSADKRFGSAAILGGLDLSIPARSITAVLGPSGSGKTTLLRIIAGFEQLDAGTLLIGGEVVDDGHGSVRPQQRGIGYVPQEGALFPHLTVRGNIGFGLGRRRGARGRTRDRVGELAELVGLGALQDRYPHQLSGGQQQRVALARALAIAPRVVLLDEPFGSLDASLRGELRDDVVRILREAGTTTVLVTHDQDEAMTVADQIALLCGGRILAHDAPRALYDDPPSLEVALSIGEANVLAGDVRDGHADCLLGPIAVTVGAGVPADRCCRLLVRPEQIAVHTAIRAGCATAKIDELQYHGHDTLVRLRVDGATADAGLRSVVARLPGAPELDAGQRVWIEVVGAAVAFTGPQ